MEKILWEKKLYKSKNPFSTYGCRSIKARDIEFETEKIIKTGKAEGILRNRMRNLIKLGKKLWPLNRSLTGKDNKRTLLILKKKSQI